MLAHSSTSIYLHPGSNLLKPIYAGLVNRAGTPTRYPTLFEICSCRPGQLCWNIKMPAHSSASASGSTPFSPSMLAWSAMLEYKDARTLFDIYILAPTLLSLSALAWSASFGHSHDIHPLLNIYSKARSIQLSQPAPALGSRVGTLLSCSPISTYNTATLSVQAG